MSHLQTSSESMGQGSQIRPNTNWCHNKKNLKGEYNAHSPHLRVRVREVKFSQTLTTSVQQTAHGQRSIGTRKRYKTGIQ